MNSDNLARVLELLELGMTTDGAHHKQWCLVQIAKIADPEVDLTDIEEGIAP